MVEESIHVKFDDKDPGNKMSELVEIFAEIRESEDSSGLGHLGDNIPSEIRYPEVDDS